MTPEISMRLAELRQKSANGSITKEELKEGLALLREGRAKAAEVSAKSRTKKAATSPNGDDVLDSLF